MAPVHPSAILRAPGEPSDEARRESVADFARVVVYLQGPSRTHAQ